MNRRFSNLAVCILGGAFLISPINQTKTEASPSIVESGTQQINKIVNRYGENQQQPQQKITNPTLISQNFVDAQNRILDQFRQQTNTIMTQPSPYAEQFKRQTNTIMTQPSPYVNQFRQQSNQIINQSPLYQQQQPFSQVSPNYSQGFQSIVDLFGKETDRIVNQSNFNQPNFNRSNLKLYQQAPHIVNDNWIRSY